MISFLRITSAFILIGLLAISASAQQKAVGFDRKGALHIGTLSKIDGNFKMSEDVTLEFYVRSNHWLIQRQLYNRSWEGRVPKISYKKDQARIYNGMVGFSKYNCKLHRVNDNAFHIGWRADTTKAGEKYSSLNEIGLSLQWGTKDKVCLKVNGEKVDYAKVSSQQNGTGPIRNITVDLPSGAAFTLSDFKGVARWSIIKQGKSFLLTVKSKVTLGKDIRFSAKLSTEGDNLGHVGLDAFEFRRSHKGWFSIEPPKSLKFENTPSFNFVDVSGAVLDAPAGKHGFLQVRDGGFYFENSPRRVRLCGTTLVHGSKFPTKVEAELLAERIAAMGCNVVRLHHLDYHLPGFGVFDRKKIRTSTEDFDAELMDRMDYLIAQLKKRGVYIHLDGLTHRIFRSGDGVPAYDKLTFGLKGTAYLYDHKILSTKQKEYLTKLWTHKNPYTGLAYKDDPVFVTTDIVNESDLFTHGVLAHHFPKPYREHIQGMFKRWCAKRGLPPQKSLEDAVPGIAGRFRMQTMRDYYRMMYSHLRDIGVKIPITGTNWIHPGTPLAVYAAHVDMDYTADHPYGGGEPYAASPYGPASRAGTLSLPKTVNKPVVHNEWNYRGSSKNIMRASSILYQIALMSSAGHDASYLFAFFHNSLDYNSGQLDSLNVGWDPAVRALLPAATLLMIRGDMATSPVNVVYQPSMADVVGQNITSTCDRFDTFMPGFSRAAFCATAAIDYSKVAFGEPAVPMKPFFTQPKASKIGAKNVKGGSAEMDEELPTPQEYPAVNCTGQFVNYWRDGYFLIKTPRSKWAIGMLPAGVIDLGDGVNLKMDAAQFACVTITSLNDKPIVESEWLMVATVSYFEQPQMYFDKNWSNPNGFKVNASMLCKPVRGDLMFPAGHGKHRKLIGKLPDGSKGKITVLRGNANGMAVPLRQDVLTYELTTD